MGQNQDKLEGGEQALSGGSEEARPSPESGGAGSHTGDVMEGGSSGEEEEEAGNARENSGEPDAHELDGSPGREPTTPSSERRINLCGSPSAEREVRQGGAAGKEGGGEGGRTARLVPQETDEKQKSSARGEQRTRAYKLHNQAKRQEKRTEKESNKMEYQDEGTGPREETQEENFSAGVSSERYGPTVTSEDANSRGDAEEDPVMVTMRRCGAHAGSEFLMSDQDETIMAEAADEDLKLCAGTVGRLSERKGPPSAQLQHPLKNSLQKESLSDVSDTIQCRAPKERTGNNTKEEMLTCEVQPVFNEHSSAKPKVTDPEDQREAGRPYQHMHMNETDSNPPSEPSSILEKLLKRNRKEKTPEVDDKDIADGNAKRILDTAATELSTDGAAQSDVNTPSVMKGRREKPPKEKPAAKDRHINGAGLKKTSDDLCSQPGVNRDATRESADTNSLYSTADRQGSENIHSTDASAKEEKPSISPYTNRPSDNLQSAVSHERPSCDVSGVIAEESAPSSLSDAKSPPTNNDWQIAADKTESTTVGPQVKSDGESRAEPPLSGSARSSDQSARRKKVKDSTEEAAAPAVDAGPDGHPVTAGLRQDPHMTLHTKNVASDHPYKKPVKESDDSVTMRDKSQSTPKPRPVSELIKETIQLHEKLQHHDRPKSVEVKPDEQGQSVKVAQMKAAFDAAQKSPDRAVERKPSMRKGRTYCSTCTL